MNTYINNVCKTAEFREIFSNGKKLSGNVFSLFFVDNNQTTTFDLGIVTRKKLAKKATQRNYLKRIIKEHIRLRAKKLKKGTKAVFLLKSDVKKIKKKEIAKTTRKDVDTLLEKADLFTR